MGKKIIIGIIILLLIGIAFKDKLKLLKGKEIRIERVERKNIEELGIYGGIVIPGDVIPVYIEASALIESISARKGQVVKMGEHLMTFSQKSIIENERELKANELDIVDIELRMADLNSGSLKLELDNRQLEIKNLDEKIRGYNRKIPVVKEEMNTLKDKSAAYMKLLSKDGVSTTEANKAVTEANKKEVELEDLKTELKLAKEKYELMIVSYESLKRELNINEVHLNSQYAKLQLTNEILKRKNMQLKKPLEASIDGVITEIDVNEGSLTNEGERLLAISPIGESVVKVEIPLYEAANIKIGNSAKIIYWDIDGRKSYLGEIIEISSIAQPSEINPGKNNKVIVGEIKIIGDNKLNPGFLVDVELKGKSKESILLVNSFSVLDENGKNYVYLIKDGKAIKTLVNIGAKTLNSYEILNLPEGSEIALNPFKLRNGERVKVVE